MSELTVEYRTTRENEARDGTDFAPEKQFALYKNAVSPFAEGQYYEKTESKIELRGFAEWQDTPEYEKSARRMAISDIEMAAKGAELTSQVSEAEVIGSIRGSAAHTITLLVNQFMLSQMAQKPLPDVPLTLPTFSDKTLQNLDTVFTNQALRNYWDNPEVYQKIESRDVVTFVEESWQNIRKLHQFTNYTHNRSLIADGQQFNSNWVQAYWFDASQTSFEEKIFDIERKKINTYIENPLFEGDPYLFIPLPMHPDLYVATEEDVRKRVNFGGYAIQFTGRIDYHLTNGERNIYIDKKFGSYDSLRTEVTEAQVLAYCYILGSEKDAPDYAPYNIISPLNSFFYDDWYDVTSENPNSYLVDLTLPQNRLEAAQQNLAKYTKIWNDNVSTFRHIKALRERAFIVPFLE